MYPSKARLLVGCLLIYTQVSFSQTPLPTATNFEKSYKQGVRDPSGAPGMQYWQNSANYLIRIAFDPETRGLTGTVGIDYSNHSPDTLNRVVFKLYPNIYQAQAIRNMPIAPEDLTKGVDIHSIELDTQLLDAKKYAIRGTNLFVKNLRILPGQKVHFEIAYSYTVNKGSFIRTGRKCWERRYLTGPCVILSTPGKGNIRHPMIYLIASIRHQVSISIGSGRIGFLKRRCLIWP